MKKEELIDKISAILDQRKKSNQITRDQLSWLTRYQLSGLTRDQLSGLTRYQLSWLTGDQLSGLTNKTLEAIKESLEGDDE